MKEVLSAWNVQDMEQMMAALTEAMSDAATAGHHASTVYPNKLRVTLVEETLSDGSKVLNLNFFDGDRDAESVRQGI